MCKHFEKYVGISKSQEEHSASTFVNLQYSFLLKLLNSLV